MGVGINMERQLSSVGCSTSYSLPCSGYKISHLSHRRRGLRPRCAAQPRPFHGAPSPERDSSRRHSQPHRPWGQVAANAASVASPPSPREGVGSLPSDLATSIPDATPSLEDLEDLRYRAMSLPIMRRGRSGALEGGSRTTASRPRLFADDADDGPHDTHQFPAFEAPPAPDPPSADPPRASRASSSHLSKSAKQGPAPATAFAGSALSQAVPPPVQLLRPYPVREHAAADHRSLPHHSDFGRRRGHAQPSVVQLTAAIKGVRDWRQLPNLLADRAPEGLDPFNAAVFLTHLAQLVVVAPPVTQADVALIARLQASALAVVEANPHEYRGRQVSNMTWALARLGLPSGVTFLRDHLVATAYPLLPWYEPQHLSNTLWALATAGIAPNDEWLEEYLTAAFVALQRRAYQPQELANILWALERLGVMPDQEWMAAYYDCVEAAAPAANGQDCSNILSSLALLSMHVQKPQATAALVDRLASRLAELLVADNKAAPGSRSSAATTAAAVSPASARGALSSVAAAAASVEVLDPRMLTPTPVRPGPAAAVAVPAEASEAEATSSAASRRAVSDQSVANSVWALAVMGRQPSPALWEGVAGAVRLRLSAPDTPRSASAGRLGMQSPALALVLWAGATMERPLPGDVMELVYGSVRSEQIEAMEPRSLATMVWAVATAPPEQLRPPPAWVTEAVAASLQGVPQLSAQAVSNMLYGLCQLRARPEPAWMSAIINHFHRNLAAEASGQSISNVLWCLAKMGYRLNSDGMDILFGLVRSRLAAWQQATQQTTQQPTQQQQQQQNTQHQHQAQAQQSKRGASRAQPLGGRPTAGDAAPAAGSSAGGEPQAALLPPFNVQELANVLYAIASMGYETDLADPLAQLLLAGLQTRLHEANAPELSNIVWSLATLKIVPSDAWMRDFCAAAEAHLPSFKARDLAQTLYSVAKLRLPLTGGRQPRGPPATVAASSSTPLAPLNTSGRRSGKKNAVPLAAGAEGSEQAAQDASAAASSAMASLLSAATATAPRLVASGNAQDLCNLSWALLQLGVPVAPDSALAAAFTARLLSLALACEPSLLAMGVWALGKWKVRLSRAELDRLESATFRQVQSMRPHELAAMLSGFVGMGHAPPVEWQEEVFQCIGARSREFAPQDWTMVLWSLARIKDEELEPQLDELVQRLQARLDRLPLSSLILVTYSAGCMGRSPTSYALVQRSLQLLGAGAGSPAPPPPKSDRTAKRGFGPAASAGEPRQRRGAQGREAQAAAAAVDGRQGDTRPVGVASLTAVELSAVMWAAVRVGVKALPAEFRAQFFRHTEPLLRDLPASLVASFLWAAGRLRMWLPSQWRWLLVARAMNVLPQMRAVELNMCIAGIAWLRAWPSRRLLGRLRTCYGARRDEMAEGPRKTSEELLHVLHTRWVRAERRHRRYGSWRLWSAHVKRSYETAVAEGRVRVRSRPLPPGYVTRREALRLGVVRKAGSRLPSEVAARERALAREPAAVGVLAEH